MNSKGIAFLVFSIINGVYSLNHDFFANYKILKIMDSGQTQEVYPKNCQELYDFFLITSGFYNVSTDDHTVKNVFCEVEKKNNAVVKGLTHYWPIDSDGRDVVGGRDFYTSGKILYAKDKDFNENSAIDLTGNYYLSVAEDIHYFVGNFTFCIWVNLHTNGMKTFRLLEFGDHYKRNNVLIRVDTETRKIYIFLRDRDGNNQEIELNKLINWNTWHHICFTLNGLRATAYLDGAKKNSVIWSWQVGPHLKKAYTIGAYVFDGPIEIAIFKFSDMIIFNRGLDENEISLIKNLPTKLERQLVKN